MALVKRFDKHYYPTIHTLHGLAAAKYAKQHFNVTDKDTLEGYGTLDSCSERSLVIYNSAIGSDNYDEFELSVNFFDLKLKNKEYKKEISRLKKSNKKYMEELKSLKSSKSWKVAKIFRK